jgi:heptosyltransferase-2
MKTYLGDAVMAAPLVDSVCANYQETYLLAGGGAPDVLAEPKGRLTLLKGRDASRPSELLALARELRASEFGVVFLVNRSFRSALAARLARIPIRVGHATEGRSLLLTHALPYDERKNEAKCYNDLAEAVGLHPSFPPRVCVTDEQRREGAELLRGATVGIQPGARYEGKQVPIDRWVEFGKSMSERGERLALLGGSDETEAASAFLEAISLPVVDLVGKCTIRQTMGALASLRLMAGSDTGLMHLAAGVGCPTVTVFGPNPASKWGHHEPPHQVLEAPGGDIRRVASSDIFRAARTVLGV